MKNQGLEKRPSPGYWWPVKGERSTGGAVNTLPSIPNTENDQVTSSGGRGGGWDSTSTLSATLSGKPGEELAFLKPPTLICLFIASEFAFSMSSR